MSKIITVWGNPGSGKSMFCCNLAKVLTAGKEKAIILNADSATPMLPVWMPDRILEAANSVGNVLSGLEINMALVAERVVVLKDYPFIGMMGYAAGETPFSYPELKYDKIRLLITEAVKLVDYLILDCSSNVLNFFTPTAIEMADQVVRILTPDLRGLNYLRAHKPLLTDVKFQYERHLTFAGLARPFHAIDEMGHLIGGFDGLLPYAKEIERCGTGGNMFHALGYCNQRYINAVKKVRDNLFPDDSYINPEPPSGLVKADDFMEQNDVAMAESTSLKSAAFSESFDTDAVESRNAASIYSENGDMDAASAYSEDGDSPDSAIKEVKRFGRGFYK